MRSGNTAFAATGPSGPSGHRCAWPQPISAVVHRQRRATSAMAKPAPLPALGLDRLTAPAAARAGRLVQRPDMDGIATHGVELTTGGGATGFHLTVGDSVVTAGCLRGQPHQ